MELFISCAYNGGREGKIFVILVLAYYYDPFRLVVFILNEAGFVI